MAENPLARLLDQYEDVGPGALTFVGGSVEATADALDRILRWMDGEGPWWSFREWTDRMRLIEGVAGAEDDVERLVAGRWFGPRADLELWREGDRFRWRVVGEPDLRAPDEIGRTESFFAPDDGEPPLLRACRDPETALLWDHTDARVATASAETLALLRSGGQRQLSYTTYYDRGAVAAVRYRGIEPVSGGRAAGAPAAVTEA